jgi:cation diffusion facilitator family transporter
VLAAVFLTLLKLVVGLLTGSLGILAEAAHSGLDLIAALVTFFAVRLSDQPPDREHPYGHGKIENLAALIETLLLLATCLWIIYEAIQRLFFESVDIEVSIWSFLVMAISIAVDISRSRMLYRVARKHKSQALEADALHFSTDIWSSAVVLVGLGLVWLGEQLGPGWSWLALADAVAALVVAAIVVWVSLQLGRRAVDVLLDSAPPGLLEDITAQVRQVPGVEEIEQVRVRQAGAATFADVTVAVDRSVSLEEAHRVATEVEGRVSALLHQGDVVVHVDPVRQSEESLPQAVRAIAARFGVRVHNIHAHGIEQDVFIDLHAEVPPELTLAAAHERINRLEAAVRQELPSVTDVSTHIEPQAVPMGKAPVQVDDQLRGQILAVVERTPGLRRCHALQVRPAPDAGASNWDVVLHCLADRNLSVAEAHRLADEAEKRLRADLPALSQVLIHLEPDDEDAEATDD